MSVELNSPWCFIKRVCQNKKMVSEIKGLTLPASLASTHHGQDVNKLASQPQREVHPPLRKTLKYLIYIFYIFLFPESW